MLFFIFIALAIGSPLPMATKTKRADMPTMPSLQAATTTYSFTPQVNNANSNPYVTTSNLPENLVFIIFGGIILLILLIFSSYFFISWIISNIKAKNQSEKYFYNSPLQFNNQDSTNSSMSSVLDRKSSMSNMSQLTLNNPLGRTYRNNQKDNRGSMFFSPTTDILGSQTNVNDSSDALSVSFHQMNYSNASLLDLGFETRDRDDTNTNTKPKRPPSQYLEDLMGDI